MGVGGIGVAVGGIGVAVGGSSVGGSTVGGSTVGDGMNCVGPGIRLVGVIKAFSSGIMMVLEQCVPLALVKAIMTLSLYSASISTYRRVGTAGLRMNVP